MNELTTAAAGFIQGFSTDFLIIIIAAVLLFFYGIYRGTHKLTALLFSVYIATLLYTVFPFTFVVISTTWSNIIIWGVLVVSVKTIIERLISLPLSFSKIRTWIESGLLTGALVVSLTFILYTFLGFATIYAPTIISTTILTSGTNFFWSIIVSFLVLYYIAFW